MLLAVAVALLAGGSVTAAVLLMHHGTGRATADADKGTGSVVRSNSTVGGGTTTPAQPTQQQAATSLAGLLSQSVSDRSSIVQAVSDVNQCGPSLSQDTQAFQNAAASRQNLLSQLAGLPGTSTLPAQMLQALTGAWQASVQADQDFAGWAQDEAAGGCTPNDHSDPYYQAAAGPDNQATKDKQAFATLWTPLAEQYGLTSYEWSRL